ncbi:hypothetical protein GOP47_0007236 [Adiantum capillus-veneris]|uniref:Uncharacterized protein n=1 Tax=Adiantum capillus-veneris TaxID=13818 RepID=A0A9D4V1R2_ADICA|nr:hypothetical protein GOP47_0007236 [Adiantum capillus-veneris]
MSRCSAYAENEGNRPPALPLHSSFLLPTWAFACVQRFFTKCFAPQFTCLPNNDPAAIIHFPARLHAFKSLASCCRKEALDLTELGCRLHH